MHTVVITLLLNYLGPLVTGRGNLALILINGAVAMVLTWILAALTFRVIEQPFLSMRRRGRQHSSAMNIECGRAKSSRTVVRLRDARSAGQARASL